MNRGATRLVAVLICLSVGVAGCSITGLFSMVPDTPTRQERDFANAKLYRRATAAELEVPDGAPENTGYYVQAEGYTGDRDVHDVFVRARYTERTQTEKGAVARWYRERNTVVTRELVTKDGRPVFVRGDRAFLVDAWEYCRNVEEQSARASGWWAGIGIPAVAVGLPAVAAGTTVVIAEAAKTDPDAEALAIRMSLAAGGYLLSFLGAYALERSSAGATASAEAGRGMKHNDPTETFEACIDARATWVSSREKAIEAVKAERDEQEAASGKSARRREGRRRRREWARCSGPDNAGGAGGTG